MGPMVVLGGWAISYERGTPVVPWNTRSAQRSNPESPLSRTKCLQSQFAEVNSPITLSTYPLVTTTKNELTNFCGNRLLRNGFQHTSCEVNSCVLTNIKAQGPPKTCNEIKAEPEEHQRHPRANGSPDTNAYNVRLSF